MPTIVTLPGDGIGPEIMKPALELLRTISEDFSFDEHLFGGAAIDVHGVALTGGIYFGEKTRTARSASDLCEYSVDEVDRIARVAFDAARTRRKKVASVDKANVLETSRQWREVVHVVHKAKYNDIELTDVLVDNCAMQLIARPADFDVIVTENLFGDIL